MEPLLQMTGISKAFTGKKSFFGETREVVQAVDGVDLRLYKGEILGLVGESGCGKSTLANIAVRLIKEDQGRVYYEGREITHADGRGLRQYRQQVQIIFQDVYGSLNPAKKIGWLLKEGLDINTSYTKLEKERRVDEVLEMVGLKTSFKKRYPHELSGGERQRAAIGMALMLEPKIIVADEAVSALDVSIQAQILNLISELRQRLQISFLFISHDLGVVHYLSDRIAVMYQGKIIEEGPAQDIFNNPEHDYTKRLFEAIPVLKK